MYILSALDLGRSIKKRFSKLKPVTTEEFNVSGTARVSILVKTLDGRTIKVSIEEVKE